MNFKLPKLKIGGIEVKVPLIQGGMSVGISLSRLASAVANEGCIGVIGAAGIGMLEPDFSTNFKEANKRALRKEIRKARENTDGIIGVNIMVGLTDFCDLVMVAFEEGADLIFLGAGLPLELPISLPLEKLKEVLSKIIPIVSSARAAKIIFQYWARHYNQIPQGVVVEGPLAGGHLGFKKEQINDPDYALEKLVPEVVSILKPFEQQYNQSIPVIAAGGIYSGTDIYKFIKLGAHGVQIATRFVTTYECDASEIFKEAYINCKKKDIIIIDSPLGLPGRAIRNKFLNDVIEGIKKPFSCPWKCLKPCDFRKVPYCIALALTNAKIGNLKDGFVFVGANAYLSDKITSVKELIDNLIKEYKRAECTKTI